MKVIILVLSVVAVIKGSHVQGWNQEGWQGASNYYGAASPAYIHQAAYPQHVPVIGKHGVPVETPEVQAAKHHFYAEYQKSAALAAQKPDPLDGQYKEDQYSHGWTEADSGFSHGPNEAIWNNNDYNNNHGYSHNNYAPVETPEVQHARAAHLQAFANVAARAAGHQHRYRRSIAEWAQPKYHGPIHVPHITAHGVPADTAEVQHARLNHQKALHIAAAQAYASGYGDEHNAWNGNDNHGAINYGAINHGAISYGAVNHWDQPKYHGPIHVPHITAHGVPADTAEVQHARLNHQKALHIAAAQAYASGYGDEHNQWNNYESGHGNAGWSAAAYNSGYDAHHGSQKWHGPQHIPILAKNGVPIDTPAVQHARHAHLTALAIESSKHAGWENAHQNGEEVTRTPRNAIPSLMKCT
ncbi:hypothetical protein WA026_000064 [Henosepilachna vigintioctopunctata]|uniref:Uncharacterized protein n=1 Tax=Henosepilachna vigintioctopunctata TaxID=420089 RepID=A0AAW1V6Q4_9CUCU